VHFLFLILAAIQSATPPTVARGDRFQIVVPQGWKVAAAARDVTLEHSTGASLVVRRPASTRNLDTLIRNLDTFAQDAVERIMAPLGFAKFERPRRSKNGNEESVQYEIRGNRLSNHRRILYRAIRRDAGVYEMLYENSEDRYDVLVAEAQAIAASLEAIVEAPPPPRGPVRRGFRD
jgi:hypothetical protein